METDENILEEEKRRRKEICVALGPSSGRERPYRCHPFSTLACRVTVASVGEVLSVLTVQVMGWRGCATAESTPTIIERRRVTRFFIVIQ